MALTLFIESERAPDLKVDSRPRFTFTHSFQPVEQIFYRVPSVWQALFQGLGYSSKLCWSYGVGNGDKQ